MNPSIVDRMCNDSVSFGKKIRIPKREFKRRERRVNYARNMALFAQASAESRENDLKKYANLERRKQHKVRYDTWRRQEMPNKEDISLENIHYANFLGDKYGDNNAPYNTEYKVNLRVCDSMVVPEEEQVNDDDSFLRMAREVTYNSEEPLWNLDEESLDNSYADPYAYIKEYADDVSELSLGSNEDLWSIPDNEEYAQAGDIDMNSEIIASAYKSMYELTLRFQKFYHSGPTNDIEIFNDNDYPVFNWQPEQSNKRDIDESYDNERAPESAFKRARCDDESNNV